MKIDNLEWKPFKLGDLFLKIYKAKAHIKAEYEYKDYHFNGSIRFISRTENNNGCDCYIEKTDNLTGIEKGNAIVIGDTTASLSYQEKDFICGDHIVICRAEWINYFTAMFILTVLKQEKYKYSYGRAFKMDLIKKTIVYLPVDSKSRPDWLYMENYIKTLKYRSISSNNAVSTYAINTLEWKNFKLSKIFKMERGCRLTKECREIGYIPFVTAGYENYGVVSKISNLEQKSYYNAITIDMFGNSFYYENEFKCDDNILVLKNKKLNKFSGLFIATILNQDKYRNSYGRQYRQKDFNNHTIKLPSIENQPDWEFMENYIKSLPYGDRI